MYSAISSPVFPNAEQLKKSDSYSPVSLVLKSRRTAKVNEQTAVPLGRYFNSGSAVVRPDKIILLIQIPP